MKVDETVQSGGIDIQKPDDDAPEMSPVGCPSWAAMVAQLAGAGTAATPIGTPGQVHAAKVREAAKAAGMVPLRLRIGFAAGWKKAKP